jgi:hypothetical protein
MLGHNENEVSFYYLNYHIQDIKGQFSWAWWVMFIIPATQEVEKGES